jgi:hypothetical protein
LLSEDGGITTVTLTGSSMEPCLRDGQGVVVGGIGGSNLRVGRIYGFIRHGRLVMHRLIWTTSTHAIFSGDNRKNLEWVAYENVVCEYRGIVGQKANANPLRRRLTVLLRKWGAAAARRLKKRVHGETTRKESMA